MHLTDPTLRSRDTDTDIGLRELRENHEAAALRERLNLPEPPVPRLIAAPIPPPTPRRYRGPMPEKQKIAMLLARAASAATHKTRRNPFAPKL